MVKAYNFLGSWQLFPEKGIYESGERPKSGLYKIEAPENKKELVISQNWISLRNEGFSSQYILPTDIQNTVFAGTEFADRVESRFIDSITFGVQFYKEQHLIRDVLHEIQPNGYLKVTQKGNRENGTPFTNTEIYHRQMSVLPYSASVAGAVVKPTEEGVIRHKALTAMEEQTNMQLEQIRKQIELLALQAQEIQKRKELAMLVYGARLSFKPEIGQIYYLYQKKDHSHIISMISPKEWGAAMPYQQFVATVQLLADHTWRELGNDY